MPKAKAIFRRRRVVTNTRKITRTMELVSTAKFRQSFNRVEGARPYHDTMLQVMGELSHAGLEVDHPLLERREPPRHVTLLVLTSNRGLCGGRDQHTAQRVAVGDGRVAVTPSAVDRSRTPLRRGSCFGA